mmetsp:Transcript_58877/g.164471  ORF Transcript_58877/g.164471 Transcript_58877/m.164471 type:complete len:307 (+) Transcript_58877:67-987(+)
MVLLQQKSALAGGVGLVMTKKQAQRGPDFSSDVGRKKFGFSHEEIDDSKAYFEGQFKFDQRCGEGTLHSLETGAKYVGEFLNDQFHGHGEQTWPDGSRYRGQWKHGQKHGRAEFTSSDGLTYVGQWEEGKRHGQGTQTYANNDKYEGWFFHGLCSGLGKYCFADGSRYEGAWANGRYDGPGMMYGCDGSRERQFYSSGLLMKREVLPPGAKPQHSSRRDIVTPGKVLVGQTRDNMHLPTVLAKPRVSKYLIRRETAGMDLSAPPLKPKTAPAHSSAPGGPGTDVEAPLLVAPPNTAPALSTGSETL